MKGLEILAPPGPQGCTDLWDGWHRVTASILKGDPCLRAIVGVRKPEPAPHFADCIMCRSVLVECEVVCDHPSARETLDMAIISKDEIAALFTTATDDEQVDVVNRYIELLSENGQDEFRDLIRLQAADEGCRWSELMHASTERTREIAGWTNAEFAEILSAKVVTFADSRNDLERLYQTLTSPKPALARGS
jgi:hypothetical protein